MIKVVSWNIGKRKKPWDELFEMARNGDADVALLQEAGSPSDDLIDSAQYEDCVWNRHLYDRWPLIVKLSDRVTVSWYKQEPPISEVEAGAIGVSGIGTIAAARVVPRESEEEAFVAVSMYARWIKPHPSANSSWTVGYADASAHRIISDLSAFIGHYETDPKKPVRHRILAAGDLNMFYGSTDATDCRLSLPRRERTVWDRMQALGLEFLGPQSQQRRPAQSPADVPADTKNTPTVYYSGGGPETATNQLDYAFASRGFHERVSVRALNDVAEWGSSDHCRLMIEVKTKADSG